MLLTLMDLVLPFSLFYFGLVGVACRLSSGYAILLRVKEQTSRIYGTDVLGHTEGMPSK